MSDVQSPSTNHGTPFHATPRAGNHQITVVIAAYTLDRWELLTRAIQSVVRQSLEPTQLILCIDNNAKLLNQCIAEWGEPLLPSGLRLEVIPDEHVDLAGREEHRRVHGIARRFGAGSVRTTALRQSRGDIIAFLDDDAEAAPDWLERLVEPYENENVVAVGGAALPRYQTKRPPWFPSEFDWVFGCTYAGMPEHAAPIRHLIGANMSARRDALLHIGGFHSVDFDDMDACHRLANAFPSSQIIYNPESIVYHYVSRERVTWHYFWRRCFHVNRHKVRAFAEMGEAANLSSERDFVTKIWPRQVLVHLRQLFHGDVSALSRLFVSITGTALAGLGNLSGRFQLRQRSNESS